MTASRLRSTQQLEADANGNASTGFDPVSSGFVETFSLSVPTAPPSAQFTASIGGGFVIASWFGSSVCRGIQLVGGEHLRLAATGLVASTDYSVSMMGQVDDHGSAPIIEAPFVVAAVGGTVDVAPGATVDIAGPVSLAAGTSVNISGTPTVDFAAGASVDITAGSVTVDNTPTSPVPTAAPQTLLASVGGGTGSVTVALPANAESLLILVPDPGVELGNPRVQGTSTNFDYFNAYWPGSAYGNLTPATQFSCPVAPDVDGSVTVTFPTAPSGTWYVVADHGLRQVGASIAAGQILPTNPAMSGSSRAALAVNGSGSLITSLPGSPIAPVSASRNGGQGLGSTSMYSGGTVYVTALELAWEYTTVTLTGTLQLLILDGNSDPYLVALKGTGETGAGQVSLTLPPEGVPVTALDLVVGSATITSLVGQVWGIAHLRN
ncbi:MAG: hypothetical protein ACYDGN_16320 [Acidimicrobiales bacterium]